MSSRMTDAYRKDALRTMTGAPKFVQPPGNPILPHRHSVDGVPSPFYGQRSSYERLPSLKEVLGVSSHCICTYRIKTDRNAVGISVR